MATIQKLIRPSLPALAYLKQAASKEAASSKICNGAVFCTGFMSYMKAKKADFLADYFRPKNMNYLRFDYTDVGESVDKNLAPKFSFKQWKNDVTTVLKELTEGPQILIGSSMGAWITLLAALEMPEKVCGLLLLAPGLDFFPRFRYLLPEEKTDEFESGSIIYIDGPYGPIPIHKGLFTETRPLHLMEKKSLEIHCPVRIIHATGDPYTPFQVSIDLIGKLASKDVRVMLIKSDDHQMSSVDDLKMMTLQLDSLIEAVLKPKIS